MITHRTNNTSINWLIDRCKFSNLARHESELTYIIGNFKGSLPYHMAEKIKEYGRKNGGCKISGNLISLKLTETLDTENKTYHSIRISFKFGEYKRNANTIDFSITEELDALTDEDLAELSA